MKEYRDSFRFFIHSSACAESGFVWKRKVEIIILNSNKAICHNHVYWVKWWSLEKNIIRFINWVSSFWCLIQRIFSQRLIKILFNHYICHFFWPQYFYYYAKLIFYYFVNFRYYGRHRNKSSSSELDLSDSEEKNDKTSDKISNK